jgi:PAS domain S-box-containing protein
LFESIDEGFFIIEKVEGDVGDPLDFRFVETNPAFEVQSGVRGVVGKTMRQVFPDEAEEWYLIFHHVLTGREPMRFKRELVRQARTLELYAFCVDDDRRNCIAVIFRDITKEVAAQTALQEADRRKDEFLAMLAHELRNPLAAIKQATMIMKVTEDDKNSQRWAGEVVERQVRHLAGLVDELLDLSRITLGKVTLSKGPLLVSTFIDAAIESSFPLIDARKHTLQLKMPDDPLQVEGDLTRLSQVLQNLLNNAAKYTPIGGVIRLKVSAEEETCRIAVRDNGEGIAPETLPVVFDLFTQAKRSLDRSQGGLGVGLALVKRLVEMHGGTVEAHSEGLNEGSEFVVRLPLVKSVPIQPMEARPRVGAGDGACHPRRILIVDDRQDCRDTLTSLLRKLGHHVMAASDGNSALRIAVDFKPDLVLLDIELPGLVGYEVARRLRKEASLDTANLVAMTGYGRDADRELSSQCGFNEHLLKPVEFDDLLSILERTQVGAS